MYELTYITRPVGFEPFYKWDSSIENVIYCSFSQSEILKINFILLIAYLNEPRID
jgi:hypothetical protein